MVKSFLSSYGITLREGGRIDIFPAAEVGFIIKGGEWISLFLIVDSGAAISALPRSDAATLNITAEKGKETFVSGIGGLPLRGWQHTIRVRLGNQLMMLPVIFLENDSAPRILGRAGIFERFSVVFEERKRRTGFLSEGTLEYKSATGILDKIA